jgi:hypothetical protein
MEVDIRYIMILAYVIPQNNYPHIGKDTSQIYKINYVKAK